LNATLNKHASNGSTRDAALGELPRFDEAEVARHDADAHRVLTDSGSQTAARCSLWWRNTPALTGHRIGLIGHYAARDDDAGDRILKQACAELAASGCTLAVGPMDGCTWRRYRFVTETGYEPPFFLEPENPSSWPRQFASAGFKALAHYCSALTDRLDCEPPQARLAAERLGALGVTLRPLEPSRWDEELNTIYRITTAGFQGGFLYQPLPESEFLALYRQVRPFVRPELVLFAMHDGRPVGFVFNIPDALQARRGRSIDTVILKTLAILPDRRYAGLGCHLTQQSHRVARELGYRRVVHALMHEKNASINLSARYGKVFRRYTLFARPL